MNCDQRFAAWYPNEMVYGVRRFRPTGGHAHVVALALIFTTAPCAAQPQPPRIAIVEENLPPLQAGIDVRIPLYASGGIAPYLWSVAGGDLPPGITLDPKGFLIGRAAKPGDFDISIVVTDASRPALSATKQFHAQVTGSLVFNWNAGPQVNGRRIDGSVLVSNGSKDDFDLTVIIVAVNEVGRATALGYQHLTLKAQTDDFKVVFGTTLPQGRYIVHADANAEIPAKKAILKQHMQTPAPLAVTQGP